MLTRYFALQYNKDLDFDGVCEKISKILAQQNSSLQISASRVPKPAIKEVPIK
jgi:hypothetical protein